MLMSTKNVVHQLRQLLEYFQTAQSSQTETLDDGKSDDEINWSLLKNQFSFSNRMHRKLTLTRNSRIQWNLKLSKKISSILREIYEISLVFESVSISFISSDKSAMTNCFLEVRDLDEEDAAAASMSTSKFFPSEFSRTR